MFDERRGSKGNVRPIDPSRPVMRRFRHDLRGVGSKELWGLGETGDLGGRELDQVRRRARPTAA